MPTTERVSQQDRLNRALGVLRAGVPIKPLGAAERSQFARRVLDDKWFRRTFISTRYFTPTWRGDRLTVLHELSHYLIPRALWARARSTGEAWVRRETAWSLLALVQHKLGKDAAKKLRQAYVANGVKYRPRRTLTAAQKAKLQNQFQKRVTKAVKAAVAVALAGPKRRRITFEDE